MAAAAGFRAVIDSSSIATPTAAAIDVAATKLLQHFLVNSRKASKLATGRGVKNKYLWLAGRRGKNVAW